VGALEQLPEQHSAFAAQAVPLGKQVEAAQVPVTQSPEQQSLLPVQEPASAVQQAPLIHVWLVEQPGAQVPPQLSLPHVLFAQSGVQHVPLTHTWPEEHETQVPVEESQY
jgi:hypothetical protein